MFTIRQRFALDYNSSGTMDHIVLYCPGAGTIWILKHERTEWVTVYKEPGGGVGGYDLKSTNDLAFAFDYKSSGKMDYIALYKPGTGTFWIIEHDERGDWFPVYKQGDPGSGIGGYDLKSPADRAFAFDYDHSGKCDHIVFYRPGTGTIWIIRRFHHHWKAVYHQGDPGSGIGGYDLASPQDHIFAFDYNSSGRQDYLALYRPGTGTFWILKNEQGFFSPVYRKGDPWLGIGDFNLKSSLDSAFALDYNGTGRMDHLVLYRPGSGAIFIIENRSGKFVPIYQQGAGGNGICGFDLKSTADVTFAVDPGTRKMTGIMLYRPGTGAAFIVVRA
jgi:hypothetical protein